MLNSSVKNPFALSISAKIPSEPEGIVNLQCNVRTPLHPKENTRKRREYLFIIFDRREGKKER